MLPRGKKSLFDIYILNDPADRLTSAATLLEYVLVQLDPHLRQSDGSAPSLSDRLRSMPDQIGDLGSLLHAVQVRNRVVHAQGAPVTEAEIESAWRALLGTVVGLLPYLPAPAAQAVRGGPPPTAPAPAVNIRGLNFDHYKKDANGQFGMNLRVTFTASGLRGRTLIVLVSFLDRDGFALRDTDRRYFNARGEVTLAAQFTLDRDRTEILDEPLFMPYDQLHLPQGRHIIRARAAAYLIEGQQRPQLAEFQGPSSAIIRTGDDYSAGAA